MSRRDNDRIAELEDEVKEEQEALNRQVEAASRLAEENKELRERLEYSQKAVKELTKMRLGEMDAERSKMVLAEREACAKLLDDAATEYDKQGRLPGMTIRTLERKFLLADTMQSAAEMIRGRK